MKVKILRQGKEEQPDLFEKRINDFLSKPIQIVHIRIKELANDLINAVIIYKTGNEK